MADPDHIVINFPLAGYRNATRLDTPILVRIQEQPYSE
jgi:hypothetical protein